MWWRKMRLSLSLSLSLSPLSLSLSEGLTCVNLPVYSTRVFYMYKCPVCTRPAVLRRLCWQTPAPAVLALACIVALTPLSAVLALACCGPSRHDKMPAPPQSLHARTPLLLS